MLPKYYWHVHREDKGVPLLHAKAVHDLDLSTLSLLMGLSGRSGKLQRRAVLVSPPTGAIFVMDGRAGIDGIDGIVRWRAFSGIETHGTTYTTSQTSRKRWIGDHHAGAESHTYTYVVSRRSLLLCITCIPKTWGGGVSYDHPLGEGQQQGAS